MFDTWLEMWLNTFTWLSTINMVDLIWQFNPELILIIKYILYSTFFIMQHKPQYNESND